MTSGNARGALWRCRGLVLLMLLAAALTGCRIIPKREPHTVFPGTSAWDKRLASLNIDPIQARQRAWDAAREDGRTQYVGRYPTVVYGKEYVFSEPVADGANLKGYHVNGNTSVVRFWQNDTMVFIKR